MSVTISDGMVKDTKFTVVPGYVIYFWFICLSFNVLLARDSIMQSVL